MAKPHNHNKSFASFLVIQHHTGIIHTHQMFLKIRELVEVEMKGQMRHDDPSQDHLICCMFTIQQPPI